MIRLCALPLAIAGLPGWLPAAGDQCGAGFSCTQPAGAYPPNCTSPCRPPQGFTPPPQQPQQPAGFFQAPPTTGTVQGAMERSGVQGAEITFPELRLRMPTIKFPTAFRQRTNAHMITEGGVAPFIQAQNLSMGLSANPTFPQGVTPPQGVPTPQRTPFGGPPQPPCDQAVPYQGTPGSCTNPAMTQAPPADDRLAARLAALDSERHALEQRLVLLQSALQQASMNQANQAAVGLAPALPQPTYANPAGAAAAQPLRPPVQHGAQAGRDAYQAQPVNYIVEPARFPEPGRLPAAAGHVIREPAAPTARISGLRVN